jgi:hypothetical protein
MKRILIATYLIGAIAVAGSDFRIQTPQGTAYGYTYPDGSFRVQAPVQQPPSYQEQQAAPLSNTYYGYNYGDSTVIVNPGGAGSSYLYGDKP